MSVNKPVIIEVDMPYDMQQAAMDCATLAFIKHDSIWVCQYSEVTCFVVYLVGWLVVKFRMLIYCLFTGCCKVHKRRI
jgi:hypothetical protein